jgi:DNA topoisomerase II
LQYLEEDGELVEPEFFCPIIPFLLVNGSQGIGTGWSTFVPPHNPRDLVDRILAKLDDKESFLGIAPFARGFHGAIEPNDNGSGFVSYGRASLVDEKTVLIDELPLSVWTCKYKDFLLSMRNKGLITSFLENHTTTKPSFTVNLKPNQLERMVKSGLENSFKLKSFLPTSNMHAFGADNQLKKFEKAEDVINEFFPIRMEFYVHRKSVIESEMRYSALLQRNKARFIELVTTGEVEILSGRKTKEQTATTLAEFRFDKFSEIQQVRNDNSLRGRRQGNFENTKKTTDEKMLSGEFDYLLSMPLSSLSSERIADLKKDALKKDEELERIQRTSASDLWRDDLNKLVPLL